MLNVGFHFGGESSRTIGQQISGSLDIFDSRDKRWPLFSAEPSTAHTSASNSPQFRVLNMPVGTLGNANADGFSGSAWTLISVTAVGVVTAVVLSSRISDKVERCNSEASRSDPGCFDQTPADEDTAG
jgi:hypothetical protein